ncbi:MAG: imidazole glycerol phosphate synthase subunit HisH [Anaerolineae bacterium]|nr:imidazole glycerol phosphate synthase subunit HisH [Gloeobacterales cyanobacterium ES-bin-313]
MVKIALVDYGVGNLHSACKALEWAGAEVLLTADPQIMAAADGIVLPGVGAFDAAMTRLENLELTQPLKALIAQDKPLLGICLGLQVLFESSEEGTRPGLGVLPGRIKRFRPEPGLTIPHMGWNQLQFDQPDCPLWHGLEPSSWVYFVHSYYVDPAHPGDCSASSVHGQQPFTAAVAHKKLWAVQFHPEKSAQSGLQMLKNFVGSL